MHDLNRVTLVGRLTHDCELRALPTGGSVCDLRLASNSRRRDPGGEGEYTDRPGYYDVSLFGSRADGLATHLTRGRRIGIDGRLQWREWESDGQKRQAVQIVADAIQFLDWREDSGEEPPLDDAALVGAAASDGADEMGL
ncbi:MAG TPA: single-stranded DNA-binding protein [Solirubrobacteraceae bacterium]